MQGSSLSERRAAREIARFLTAHERCGLGFGVTPAGGVPGEPLTIDCRGCGESLRHHGAAEGTGAMAMADAFETSAVRRETAGTAAPELATEQGPAPMAVPRFHLPRWRLPEHLGDALIWTAIVTVAGTLAVGIVRHAERDQQQGAPRFPAAAPGQAQDPGAPTAPPAARSRGADGAAQGPGGTAAPVRPRFADRIALEGLSLGVPSGWHQAASGGAVGIEADDGTAAIRIFASSGPPPKDFVGSAARFLADEHPGASIGPPDRSPVAGVPATRILARYPGGRERALVFAVNGSSYMVLARITDAASPRVRAQARAGVASLRPA